MNPVVALIITNAIWGAAAPIFKYSLENIPPFTLGFVRFLVASILFLPFVKAEQFKHLSGRHWIYIAIGSIVGMFLHIALFLLGLLKAPSINAPLIGSTGPILLYFASIKFLRERRSRKVLFGMFIGLIGTLFVIFSPVGGIGADELVTDELIGNLYLFIAVIAGTVGVVMFKKVAHRLNSVNLTTVSFLFTTLGFYPFSLWELRSWSFAQLDLRGIIGLVFGIIFVSAIAYVLYIYGLARIKAEEVGIFTYVDPVVAVLIAIPLLHEYPGPMYLIGALFVFVGIFVAENRLHWHPFHRIKMK